MCVCVCVCPCVLTAGRGASAQTNILGRYTRDEFLESSPTTIGVEFLTKVPAFAASVHERPTLCSLMRVRARVGWAT
jgi:hypothetical protein